MAYNLTGPTPDFDIVLRDESGNEVGFKVVGSKGEHDSTAIQMPPVERSSLKTSQGNQSYSDLEPPYTVLAQSDWSGGRGAKTYEEDVTRFYDSQRCNTGRAYKIFLGGREKYGSGLRASDRSLPGSMRMLPLAGDQGRLAVKFQASSSYTVDQIGLWVSAYGSPSGNLTVRLRSDSAGSPGTVRATATITYADLNTLMVSELFYFSASYAITSASSYWVEVYADTSDLAGGTYWKVGVKEAAGTTKESVSGSSWSASAYDLYYSVMDGVSESNVIHFEYLGAQYFVTQPDDGSASKLYKNGVHRQAISNAGALDKVKVSGSPGWSVDRFAGCVVKIIDGAGLNEKQAWRTITSNSADELTVEPDWLLTHDATTSILILGEDVWSEVTGTNLTKPVTDVAVTETDVVYLAQGEEAVIQQMREVNLSGTWTFQMSNTTVKAVFLETYYEGDDQKILRSNGNTTVGKCPVVEWNSLLAFPTGIEVGSKWDRITGLVRYVDSSEAEQVWIWKQSGPWVWDGASPVRSEREEFRMVASDVLGRVAQKSDVYLFFSVMNTVWRFYDPSFDDIGPMASEYVPDNSRGVISAIVAYPGRTLISINAVDGYSSVLENTGGGSWHEVYRAPKGEAIIGMAFQVVPGTGVDKLWIHQSVDMVYIPYPSNAFDPKQDASYTYAHEGMVELSPMFAGLMDAWKYWKTLKLQMEGLVADTTWIEADYRLDDGEWKTMAGVYTTMPMQERDFGVTDDAGRAYGVSSKKFQLRLRLITLDETQSPLVTAVVIEAVTVAKPKYTYTFATVIDTRDLNGKPDESLTPTGKVELLKTWAGTAQSLWMSSVVPLFDGVAVFLAPMPIRNMTISEKEQEWTYALTITLQEA